MIWRCGKMIPRLLLFYLALPSHMESILFQDGGEKTWNQYRLGWMADFQLIAYKSGNCHLCFELLLKLRWKCYLAASGSSQSSAPL